MAQEDTGPEGRSEAPVLWIGGLSLLPAVSEPYDEGPGSRPRILAVRLSDVTGELILSMAPRAAFSALAWPGGDAVEAARLLVEAGFDGPYRIVSPHLPDHALVEREIREAAPGLDVEVIPLARAFNRLGRE